MIFVSRPEVRLSRKSVLTSVSLIALGVGGPLVQSSQAQTVIDDDLTTPITTSTVDNGNAADVEISSTGSIDLEDQSDLVAITIDSDNNLLMDGTLTLGDTDDVEDPGSNQIAILVEEGLTSDIEIGGQITLLEEYTREDQDDDDDNDGPIAIGDSRSGLIILGSSTSTHTGNITFSNGSSLTVEANDGIGIQVQSNLDGNLSLDGSVSVFGDNAKAIDLQGDVTGDTLFSSGVTAIGENAIGVSIVGDVGGAITVEGSINASGFVSTTATNYISPSLVDEDTTPLEERLDADELLLGGPAFALSGNAANGILINGAVDTFRSQEDIDDETKDTVDDFDENRSVGTIISTGSAPALLIDPDWGAAADSDIILGTVVEKVRDTTDDDNDDDINEVIATFEYEQGFINRGSIIGDGQNVGFDAVALRIKGSDDGQFSTIIQGGILNAGSIAADGFEANAMAVDLLSGTVVGSFENSGTIDSDVFTSGGHVSTALSIGEGVDLQSLDNSGTISASVQGDSGSAIAIVDHAGLLNTIVNTGEITSAAASTSTSGDVSLSTIAIDLSSHDASNGVTITQLEGTPIDDVNGDDQIDGLDMPDPRIVGDILFGAGGDTFDIQWGTVDGDIDFGTGADTLLVTNAEYEGDVQFGGAGGSLSLTDSEFTGGIKFSGLSNTLSFQQGTIFEGDFISPTAGTAFAADSSTMFFTSGTNAGLSSLDVTGTSVLRFEIDPATTTDRAFLDVAGTANLGANTKIQSSVVGIENETFVQDLIIADQIISESTLDESVVEDAPFIYTTALLLDDGDRDTLSLQYQLKTAEELNFDVNQANAYGAVLEIFSEDVSLGTQLASISEANEFYQAYNLLLPQRTDASTRYLESQMNATFGSLADRIEMIRAEPGGVHRFWIQEHFAQVEIDADGANPGYNGDGFTLSLGVDEPLFALDAVGIMGSISSGDFEEKTGGLRPVSTTSYTVGAYVLDRIGMFDLAVSGQIGKVDFNSQRDVVVGDFSSDVTGEWQGWMRAASVSASTHLGQGRFFARPRLTIDYFGLSQDGYTETASNGLNAIVSDSDTDRAAASAMLTLGSRFGGGGNKTTRYTNNPDIRDTLSSSYWTAELDLGARTTLTSTPYTADVVYEGFDTSFKLTAAEQYPDSFIAGLGFNGYSEYLTARLGLNAELSDEGVVYTAGVSFRLKF